MSLSCTPHKDIYRQKNGDEHGLLKSKERERGLTRYQSPQDKDPSET
jgi:hypothetical protein